MWDLLSGKCWIGLGCANKYKIPNKKGGGNQSKEAEGKKTGKGERKKENEN